MPADGFERAVFVNCPFDDEYAPLLEASLFCIVYFGFKPRLANKCLEAGENRLDKITRMIGDAKYSIHDLSRCRANERGEYFIMNMPFEYGIDVGFRRSGNEFWLEKTFVIFERNPCELKRALSDIAGQDVAHLNNEYENIIKHVRDPFELKPTQIRLEQRAWFRNTQRSKGG